MKKVVVLLFFSMLGLRMSAQVDFPLSFASSPPLSLNVANTGMFYGYFRLNAYNKSQMNAGEYGGIRSFGASAEFSVSEQQNVGLGLSVYNNSVNKNGYQDFSLAGSFAYRIALYEDYTSSHSITFGLQAGLRQFSYDVDKLVFPSQWDPSYPSFINPDLHPNIPYDKRVLPDASLGGLYEGVFNSRCVIFGGLGLWHLIPDPKKEMTIFKTTITAGSFILTDFGSVTPSVLYSAQGGSQYVEIGALTKFVNDRDNGFIGGLYFRNPNVLIPAVGVAFNGLTLMGSMEFYAGSSFSNLFNISLTYTPFRN